MALSVCILSVVNTMSENIYITPSSDLQTAEAEAVVLNFHSVDGLDFRCILYQAKCVVNSIIWHSVVRRAKSNWKTGEIDCVCSSDKLNKSVTKRHPNVDVISGINKFNITLNALADKNVSKRNRFLCFLAGIQFINQTHQHFSMRASLYCPFVFSF